MKGRRGVLENEKKRTSVLRSMPPRKRHEVCTVRVRAVSPKQFDDEEEVGVTEFGGESGVVWK